MKQANNKAKQQQKQTNRKTNIWAYNFVDKKKTKTKTKHHKKGRKNDGVLVEVCTAV